MEVNGHLTPAKEPMVLMGFAARWPQGRTERLTMGNFFFLPGTKPHFLGSVSRILFAVLNESSSHCSYTKSGLLFHHITQDIKIVQASRVCKPYVKTFVLESYK